jgi:3-deoxy-D-manno-octulosonic-acid transferase
MVHRKALDAFTYFVQNESSKNLLYTLKQMLQYLDTRFDRVATILEKDNTLDFIAQFKDSTTIVKFRPKDEDFIVNFINSTALNVKFIIAPHNIKTITKLKKTAKTVLFSEKKIKT